MADERKVICPRGHVMEPIIVNSIGPLRCLGRAYRCECGWTSPPEMSEESAYLAATRTPPNRPLTREQVEALDDLSAVWVVGETDIVLMSVGEFKRTYGWCMRYMWMFASKPTHADIEAARKELT